MMPRYVGVPSPPSEKVLDLSRLDGGLNLWELSYRIKANQSPDMENMYWVDGALGSRPGQRNMYETPLAAVYATHERLFNGSAVFHAGTKLYAMDIETGIATEIYAGLTAQWGVFFIFDDDLYYKNGVNYVVINSVFHVDVVVGFEPIIVINRNPDGTGGSINQSENRIAAGKWVHFTSNGTDAIYHLPIIGLDATPLVAIVNGVTMAETTNFTVDRTAGTVTFLVIPVEGGLNNVKIKLFKSNTEALASIMTSRAAINYGGDNDLGVVIGGCTAQPNAYFWSGNNGVIMDPTYFPMENYNLAGNADEYITTFGKQQKLLVIFKEHSMGKTTFSIETISGKDYLKMPYIGINANTGCDLPRTVQLVQNNLVWCNTSTGICMLLDSTTANENNIATLSRNVNGTTQRPGLLSDIRNVSASVVSAVDDDERFWVVANGNAYVWDYTISPYGGVEENLSWFLFTNINAVTWFKDLSRIFYGTVDGNIVTFDAEYNDMDAAYERKYSFAPQIFEHYGVLKDVVKVIFTVRSDSDTVIDILYDTDYESRYDPTPIRAYSNKLVPRNLVYRFLGVLKYAKVNVRNPGCINIRHFLMTLSNNTINTDMSLVSAQVVYRNSGEDR